MKNKLTKNKFKFMLILLTIFQLSLNLSIILYIAGKKSPEMYYYINELKLMNTIKQIDYDKDEQKIRMIGVKEISHYNNKYIYFTTYTKGYLSFASCYGIYYSLDGEPHMPYAEGDFVFSFEDGWKWSGRGDDYGITKHIKGNWYTFEMHW